MIRPTRPIWIITAIMVTLSACGQGNHSLRASNPGKSKNSEVESKVEAEGAFTAPANSDTLKMQKTQANPLFLRVQKETISTKILCADSLLSEKTLQENEALKIKSGSQLIVNQDVKGPSAVQNPLKRNGKLEQKKAVLNVMCMKARSELPAGIVANVEIKQSTEELNIAPGNGHKFTVKFGDAGLKNVNIGCIAKANIAESGKFLSESSAEGSDILMVEGSAIQFATGNTSEGVPLRYILTCAPVKQEGAATVPPPASPPPPPVPEPPQL